MANANLKGWFSTPGRPGDRTLDQQLLGLKPLLAEVRGKRVLDVGCAEGLIAGALYDAGAKSVLGVDIVAAHVQVARELADGCDFMVADANDFRPLLEYDIALMLAILHKLRDPTECCKRIVKSCSDLCVIRLPEAGAVIHDARSGGRRHDIRAAMKESGFELERCARGSFSEWVGYFRRTT